MSAPRGVVFRVVILERDADQMKKYTLSDALDHYEITVVSSERTDEFVDLDPDDWG